MKFVPCAIGDAYLVVEETALLFYNSMVRIFGILETIVLDHDTLFTSLFWQAIHKFLEAKLLIISAFHLVMVDKWNTLK